MTDMFASFSLQHYTNITWEQQQQEWCILNVPERNWLTYRLPTSNTLSMCQIISLIIPSYSHPGCRWWRFLFSTSRGTQLRESWVISEIAKDTVKENMLLGVNIQMPVAITTEDNQWHCFRRNETCGKHLKIEREIWTKTQKLQVDILAQVVHNQTFYQLSFLPGCISLKQASRCQRQTSCNMSQRKKVPFYFWSDPPEYKYNLALICPNFCDINMAPFLCAPKEHLFPKLFLGMLNDRYHLV